LLNDCQASLETSSPVIRHMAQKVRWTPQKGGLRPPKEPDRRWIGRVSSRDITAASDRDFRDWCVRLVLSEGDHRDISFSHCSHIRSVSIRLQSLYCCEWRAIFLHSAFPQKCQASFFLFSEIEERHIMHRSEGICKRINNDH
jgi:hypothetical protein